MNGGRFVGRIGGLAVALGVGVALASGQSVAWADDGGSPDTDAAAASPPATGTAPHPNTPAAPDSVAGAGDGASGDDNSDTAAEYAKPDSDADAPESEDPEPTDAPASQRNPAKPDRHAPEVADATTKVDSGETQPDTGSAESGSASRAPRAAAHRRQQIDDGAEAVGTKVQPRQTEPARREVAEPAGIQLAGAVQSAQQADAAVTVRPVSADAVAAQLISMPPDEQTSPEKTIDHSALTVLAAATLGPLTSGGPATPVDSPVEMALLAVGTRLRTPGEPTAGQPASSVVAAALVDETSSGASTFAATALATVDSAPTVPQQPIGVPNPATGVVTGSVNASDADSDPLTYTMVTGPAKGTVKLDPATGAYTYTPTQLARLAAGATAGPDLDSFTVSVGDGQQTTNASVSVYVSPLQYSTGASLATGPAPAAAAVSSDGRMFVANTGSWSVSVINTATGKQIDAQPNNWFSNDIGVGPWPGALLLSPDGKKLYVANTGWLSVSVIDTTTYKAIDADPANWFSNDIGVGFNPSAMTLGPDGRLYVANRGGASVSVVDTTTYKRIDTDPANWFSNDIAVGSAPSALALSGSQLYVANRDSNTVSVIDTATYRVTKTLAVGKQPSAMALAANGRLYVVNTGANTVSVIDTIANTVAATTISVGTAPTSIAFDSTTNRAFVANGNDTVFIIDTATNTVIGTGVIDTDKTGGHAVTVGPNGTVYVTDTADNTVRVLTLTRGNTAPVVGTPSIGSPDTDTGAVTVALSMSDPDGDVLNWGWSDPSTGTVSDNEWTGGGARFVFTPNQAARDAAARGGPTSTNITVNVTENAGSIPVNVTVPILPTVGPTQLTVVGAVTLPGSIVQPRTATMNPAGTRAVIITDSQYGVLIGATAQVTVINTTTGKQIGTTLTVPGRTSYTDPQYSADGTRVAITTSVTDSSYVTTLQTTTVDLNTGARATGAGIQPVGNATTGGASSTLSLVTSTTGGLVQAAVFDTVTGQQVGQTLALPGEGSVDVSRDGSRAVLRAVQTDEQTGVTSTRFASLNTTTGHQIGTTTLRSGSWDYPYFTGPLGDDGSRAVIIRGLDLSTSYPSIEAQVIDTASGVQIGDTIALSGWSYGGFEVSDDGSRVMLITNAYADGPYLGYLSRLTVIDAAAGVRIGSTTTLDGFPDGGVRFDADTNRAVVTAMGSKYVDGQRMSTTEVAIINPATGLQLGTTLTLFDEVRSGSQVSGDGSIVVTSTGTKLAVLSTAAGRQLGNTITRASIGGVVVSADGDHVVFLTGPSSIFGWEPIQAEVLRIS